jgi:hypothetical protein
MDSALAAATLAAPLTVPTAFAAATAVQFVFAQPGALAAAARFAVGAGEAAGAAVARVALQVGADFPANVRAWSALTRPSLADLAGGAGRAICLIRMGADPPLANVVGAGIAVVGAVRPVRQGWVGAQAPQADVAGAGVAVIRTGGAVRGGAIGRAVKGVSGAALGDVARPHRRTAERSGGRKMGSTRDLVARLEPARELFVAVGGAADRGRAARQQGR